VLTGVSTTPLARHAAAQDALVAAVAARFDAAGRPRDAGPARLVDRGEARRVLRVTLRRPALDSDFPDALLETSRPRRTLNNFVRAATRLQGSRRSEEVVATVGARGATKVRTARGEIEVQPDHAAVARLKARTVDQVKVDRFAREGGLLPAPPVKDPEGEVAP
jgi:hypothetical protein